MVTRGAMSSPRRTSALPLERSASMQRTFSQQSAQPGSPGSPGSPSRSRPLVPRRKSSGPAVGAPSVQHRGKIKSKAGEWAYADPDEIFRRLDVREVQKVEAKLRSSASNKQSELRSMVSERYRDLLLSTTQISTIHDSSILLSKKLKKVQALCEAPVDKAEDQTPSQTPGADVGRQLPLAASVKLLIDAPEALHAQLSSKAYLDCALLWLLARLVKEDVIASSDAATYSPLVQKQWEVLVPFRGVIVERATASLRARPGKDHRTLAETILAIMLLDSHNVQDALSVFLDQRLAALTSLFSTLKRAGTSSAATSRRPSIEGKSASDDRRSRIQRLDAVRLLRELSPAPRPEAAPKEVDTSRMDEHLASKRVLSTVVATIRGLAETLAATRAVFGVELRALIEAVQKGNGNGTESVLKKLPSAQILLSYLPPSVRSFTPYITASQPDLEPIIASWTERALNRFQDSLGSWLRDIKTVSATWSIRRQTKEVLRNLGTAVSKTERKHIFNIIESGCGRHIHRLWERRLRHLADDFEISVRQSLKEIERGDTEGALAERDPSSLRSAKPNYPQVPAIKLGSARSHSYSQLTDFRREIESLVAARTPLVHHVISISEDAAATLASDLRSIRASDLSAGFDAAAKDTFGKIVSGLQAVFAESTAPESRMFIGRIAFHLTASSDLPLMLRARDEINSPALLELGKTAFGPWAGSILKSASNDEPDLYDLCRQLSLSGLPLAVERRIAFEVGQAHTEALPQDSLIRALRSAGHEDVAPAIQKTQLLWRPFVAPGTLQSRPATSAGRNGMILPFGTVDANQDFVPPTPVAKPCARFGMISLA